MTDNLKAGLIGCGRIGYQFDQDPKRNGVWTHAGAYNKLDGIEFIGVYDTDHQAANKCAKVYKNYVYEKIDEMIRDLDVISVAVPEEMHPHVLMEIVDTCKRLDRAPKVLWIEKPFTGKFNVARSIVDELANFNCHVHVNYQRRYCEGFRQLKKYGQPKHVHVGYTRGLLNTGSHFVDFIVGLYQMPDRVVRINNHDFVMDYKDFVVNFNMLDNLDYNLCHTTLFYHNKVVTVPPLMTKLIMYNTIESDLYSEYKDLGNPTINELRYEPMLDQAIEILNSIKTERFYNLNNGLQALAIIKGVLNVSN